MEERNNTKWNIEKLLSINSTFSKELYEPIPERRQKQKKEQDSSLKASR